MANLNLEFNLVFVSNPLKSSQFYQKIFNLKPLEESPTFVLFQFENGMRLGLWSSYTAEPSVCSSPGAIELCFPSQDVDAHYAKIGEKQATVIQKPTDMDFGRTFVFLDPDGHRLRVYKLNEGER